MWRKITAEQYRIGGDAAGDYDEAYIRDPDSGIRREVWDVGCEQVDGKVVIYTSLANALMVPPNYAISVR